MVAIRAWLKITINLHLLYLVVWAIFNDMIFSQPSIDPVQHDIFLSFTLWTNKDYAIRYRDILIGVARFVPWNFKLSVIFPPLRTTLSQRFITEYTNRGPNTKQKASGELLIIFFCNEDIHTYILIKKESTVETNTKNGRFNESFECHAKPQL